MNWIVDVASGLAASWCVNIFSRKHSYLLCTDFFVVEIYVKRSVLSRQLCFQGELVFVLLLNFYQTKKSFSKLMKKGNLLHEILATIRKNKSDPNKRFYD